MRLDPAGASARVNLLAAINNWALELAEREQFAAGIELLAQGRALDPDHSTFVGNDIALRERWLQSLCQQGQWAQAEAALERAAAAYPSHEFFQRMRQQIAERRATDVERQM